MNIFKVLTSNYILNVGIVAWFAAQTLKMLFTIVFTHKVVWERMVGAGGMPSSHSALASSIAMAMHNKVGFSSPEFGLAIAFAAVVMYDAMGVRRAAGEQAKVINRIVFEFTHFPLFGSKPADKAPDPLAEGGEPAEAEPEDVPETSPLYNKRLKEFLGHTPLEVLAGCLVGILVAMFMPIV